MKSVMHRFNGMIPALLLLFGVAGAFPAQAAYKFTTVDYPGALNTQFWGISNVGQIVGYADFDNFVTPGTNFVYDPKYKTFTVLPNVSSVDSTSAIGINKLGVVVGSAGNFDRSSNSGLIISQGAFTFFAHLGWPFTEGRGINDAGLITGFATDFVNGNGTGFIYNPVARSFTDIVPSELTIAQGINKHNQVVGSAVFAADGAYQGSLPGTFGFMRNTDGNVTFFQVNANDNRTSARGITGTGRIAGFFHDGNSGKNRGFVGTLAGLSNHVLTIPAADVLDVPDSIETFVEGIADSGSIVGFWTDSSGFVHGFIATPIPPKKK